MYLTIPLMQRSLISRFSFTDQDYVTISLK